MGRRGAVVEESTAALLSAGVQCLAVQVRTGLSRIAAFRGPLCLVQGLGLNDI